MNEPPLLQGQYAGFVTRAVAFGIDTAIVTGLAAALSWILVRPLELAGVDLTSCSLDSLSLSGSLTELWCLVYIFALPAVVAVTIVGYYVLFWTLTGWTIGKGLMGVRIVRVNGSRLSFGRSLLRYFAYWLSMLPLGAGFFWVLLSDRRQGWHDKIAGTYVLYSWEARESEMFLRRLGRYGHELAAPDADDYAGPALPSGDPIDAAAVVELPQSASSAGQSGDVRG